MRMKNLYICGDSFCCFDHEYAIKPWMTILQELLGPPWQVKSLAIPCASNLHISLQVDTAITSKADLIIFSATSSVRSQGRMTSKVPIDAALIDRFRYPGGRDTGDLACWSFRSLDHTCVFDKSDIEVIQKFYGTVFDLDLAIYENQCIIERTLYKLIQSKIIFYFDQGGFEHPKFTNSLGQNYFREFDVHRSGVNIWDFADLPLVHRPFYHIADQDLHQRIGEHYFKKIIDLS